MSMQRTFLQLLGPTFWRCSLSQHSTISCIKCHQTYSTAITQEKNILEDEDDLLSGKENPRTKKPSKPRKEKVEEEKTDKVTDDITGRESRNFSKFTPIAKLITEYIDKHNDEKGLWKYLPKPYMRQLKIAPKSIYIIEKSEAVKLASQIKSQKPDLNSPVVELHAGLGFLTSELVNTIGFKYVSCMEDDPILNKMLTDRFKITLLDTALDKLPRYHHLDKVDGGERIQSFLDQIQYDKQSKDSGNRQLYIVGALPNISSMNFLIRCLASRKVFFENDYPGWSGVTMYVALGGIVDLICNATTEDGLIVYRGTSILFQTLFKCKEIGKIPRKSFIPWETEKEKGHKGPRKPKLNVKDPENLRVFRIEVNEENVNKIGRDNLFTYFYFVRHHLFARKNKVIPELERWVPGCGVRLVKQGYDIFSIIGLLKPEQVLDLYLQFVSWPEFQNSSFLNAAEKYLTRVEISEEEDGIQQGNHDFHSNRKS